MTSHSGVCDAVSEQGNVCAREAGHVGCHEVYVNGDGRRWWGDARWAPWEWIVYNWTAFVDSLFAGPDPDEEF